MLELKAGYDCFFDNKKKCSNFFKHKDSFLHPCRLGEMRIPFDIIIQHPGIFLNHSNAKNKFLKKNFNEKISLLYFNEILIFFKMN